VPSYGTVTEYDNGFASNLSALLCDLIEICSQQALEVDECGGRSKSTLFATRPTPETPLSNLIVQEDGML